MKKTVEKELLNILKLVLIPQLQQQIDRYIKTEKDCKEKESELELFYAGLALGSEEHLNTLKTIVKALEGE